MRAPHPRSALRSTSAKKKERDVRRAEEAGFARYLTKQVKVDELIETLDRLLHRRRPASLASQA